VLDLFLGIDGFAVWIKVNGHRIVMYQNFTGTTKTIELI
jgi:hypothetical protein